MSTEVTAILDFARSDLAGERMAEVKQHDLPSGLPELIDDYEAFDDHRDRFLWKWVHKLAPQFTIPSVAPEYEDRVRTDKVIATLFITLLDDVLEDRKDRATFEEASKVPFPHQDVRWDRDDVDHDYVEYTERVWETLDGRLRDAPAYEQYKRTLLYDLKQAINAVDYSSLVTDQPHVATLHELTRYESHNMMLFVYGNIDLMHSPSIDARDLPLLRKAMWCSQRMARIGNWVSTWERELREGDYSSGVLVYAFQHGIVSPSDLEALEGDGGDRVYADIVERIEEEEVEEMFLSRWDQRYRELKEVGDELSTIDLTPYVEGMKEVLRFHLASKGLK